MFSLHTDAVPDAFADAGSFDALRRFAVRGLFVGHARPRLRRVRALASFRAAGWRIDGFEGPRLPGINDADVPASTLLADADLAVRRAGIDALRVFAADVATAGRAVCRLDLGALPAVAGAERDSLLAHALDSVLPAIHDLAKATPEVMFAIATAGREADWPRPDDLATLLGELKRPNVGWWFDAVSATASAGRSGQSLATWFEIPRLFGATLRDAGGDDVNVPLGAGAVDFREIADHMPRDLPKVIRLDARYGLGAIEESVAFARDRFGAATT